MASFNCSTCGAKCVDTDAGYITGCEHHPVTKSPERAKRATFHELVRDYQATDNPVTRASYQGIINNRVAAMDFT